jgi:6-phosphogluconolactonase
MRRLASILIALALGTGCSHGGRAHVAAGATSAPATSGSTSASSSSSTAATKSSSTTTTASIPAKPPATPAGPATSRFLYTANYGDASITELRIDPATGAPAVFGTVATGDAPLRLAVEPTNRFVYSIERIEVTPLAVGPAGGLTPIGPGAVAIAGDYPLAACATPDGALLVVTYYGGGPGGSVRTFAIGPTGGLTQLARYALGATASPVDVTVDATSRFAYVADGIGQTIVTLAIVPGAGTLVPVGPPVACPDVSALALDATGRFLVAMTSASPGTIQAFAVAATGGLSPRGGPLGTGPHSPMAITRGPDGRFYVITANSSLLVATIDAQGTLTEASVTQVPAYGFPCGLAIDGSGRFVYTANFAGDDLSVLQVGAGGAIGVGSNVAIAPRTSGGTAQPYFVATVR